MTPKISFAPPNALLLEVRGSLRLFGGLANIKSALVEQARKRLSEPQIGIAPTAKGALWLSRQGNSEAATLVELRARLRALPLYVTGWPTAVQDRLAEMGVKSIGDVTRLPREGLARRIGSNHLRDLDRAWGGEIDLHESLELPESLCFSIDLVTETTNSPWLIEAASELFDRLMSDLQRRQRQIAKFAIRFRHLHEEPSVESFELLEPTHRKQRLVRLLTHRLERVRLRAPVIAVELETGDLLDMHIAHPELLQHAQQGRYGLDIAMVERLRERLGPKNVYGIALFADHRPESAWLKAAVGLSRPPSMESGVVWENRPLWLLHSPSEIDSKNGRPVYRGALRVEAGPERIESGWWDQNDISRDYFAAICESGERLWIYRDNMTKRWYLHGFFG